MSKLLSELLKEIADNPDDLTKLPEYVRMAETLEQSEAGLMEKVDKLHTANKKYLQMVTVSEPKKEEETEEPPAIPTLKEVAEDLAGEK